MRSILKYIIVFSVICGMIPSCTFKEDVLLPDSGSDDGTRLVVATVQNFSTHDVATRATEDQERQINNLAMFVFGKKNNNMVLIADPLYVEGEQLNFVINTTRESAEGQYISNMQGADKKFFRDFDGDLRTCRIYIVANMNSKLKARNLAKGSNEDLLLDTGYQILANVPADGAEMQSIEMPDGGFPMIGCTEEDIDLRSNASLGSGTQTTLNIALKKMFAKINVKFLVQLNAENVPGGMGNVKTPYFAPIEWSVSNIPTDFTLRDSDPVNVPTTKVFNTQKFNTFKYSTDKATSNKRIENSDSGSEYLEFSFYMPEYKVLPRRNREHPDYADADQNLMQYFKPKFCDDKDSNPSSPQYPTYVTIKGLFSNHQGAITEVQYKLYLGQDEIDDFQILRNQELNNTAIIRGLRSHSGGSGDVSIDHRVDVTSSGYSIAMERETLLDSHFEFRPMDISIQEGAVVVVKFPQQNNTWYAAERADDLYSTNKRLYDSNRPGLRKYFTDDLIQELRDSQSDEGPEYFVFHGPAQNNNGLVEQETYRIWFYFDENVDMTYDDSKPQSSSNSLFRESNILVDFYESEADYASHNPTKKDQEFTFRQMSMWVINGHLTGSRYTIEYFEEYLYNYAADDNFGVVRDGMPWGLNNQQLSNKHQAIYADNIGGILGYWGWTDEEFFNAAFQNVDAKYDFYLTRDGLNIQRDYSGLAFTQEIVNQSGIVNKTLSLSQNADSAVEYCYNKNMRNSYGDVETIHWYLPAIDETEEILVDGFNYFPVFQSKWYWSSQPAYDRCNYEASFYLSILGSANGFYFRDDLDRARATRVTGVVGDATSEDSGVTGAVVERNITVRSQTNISPGTESPTGDKIEYDPGNQQRANINRVRCVYDPDGFKIEETDRHPARRIFGTYEVTVSSARTGGTVSTIDVTISESDNEERGNVKIDRFFHPDYQSTEYPVYANYADGVLTLTMPDKVGVHTYIYNRRQRTSDVKPAVYNGNSAVNTSFKLKFNETDESSSFTVVNNNNSNYYLRISYTDVISNWGWEQETTVTENIYIRSFIKIQE